MKKISILLLFVISSSVTASSISLVCGKDFIQIYDNNGKIEDIRVNDNPAGIFTSSHKITDSGNVDTFLVYGREGLKTVSQIFSSGDNKSIYKQDFILSESGSPEFPGEPVGNRIACK